MTFTNAVRRIGAVRIRDIVLPLLGIATLLDTAVSLLIVMTWVGSLVPHGQFTASWQQLAILAITAILWRLCYVADKWRNEDSARR
jgi:hypothetical protein